MMSSLTATETARARGTAREAPSRPFASGRRLLWAALGTQRRELIAASALYSAHQLGESLVPVVIGLTVSRAIAQGSWASIVLWLLALGADFAFLSLSYRFGARASMRAKQKVGHRVRVWLTDRVVGPAGGIEHPPGDLLSRASSDADRVGAYAGMLATAIAAAVVLVASTVLLLRFSLLLGAAVLVGTIALLLAQSLAARVLARRSSREQDERARATVLAEDLIRGLRVLRGIRAQRTAASGYQRSSQAALRASLHATSAQAALSSLGTMLTGLYLVLIAALGGWLALTGRLGLGQLIAALGLGQFVIGPMQVISGASAAYARASASAERIREVLVAAPAVIDPAGRTGGVAPDERRGAELELELVDVVLEPTTDRPGRAVSLAIARGIMTGIVCGDPVVAALLPRLIARETDPAAGRLLLGGVPAGDWPLTALRQRVLVGFHDAPLFPGSIAENLAALSADADAIARAARAAFAEQVVRTVPAGERTLVGERGETLSGGQRQRIALARLLAAEPPTLVLHDPTTAVDAATEAVIAARVHALRAERTTVVVTTSTAWLSCCEQLVFLGAAATSCGTHLQLLDDPEYREVVAR